MYQKKWQSNLWLLCYNEQKYDKNRKLSVNYLRDEVTKWKTAAWDQWSAISEIQEYGSVKQENLTVKVFTALLQMTIVLNKRKVDSQLFP